MTDVTVGTALFGLGWLIIALVLAYFFYHIGRFYKNIADKDEIYTLVEVGKLYDLADKQNLNLDIMREKLRMIKTRNKTFKDELEKRIIDDFFSKGF